VLSAAVERGVGGGGDPIVAGRSRVDLANAINTVVSDARAHDNFTVPADRRARGPMGLETELRSARGLLCA